MTELNGRNRAEAAHQIRDAAISGYLVVLVNAGAAMGLAAARFDRGLLVEDDAGAADRIAPHLDEMPVRRRSIRRVVLAHRGDDDPVVRDYASQRDRVEQLWRGGRASVTRAAPGAKARIFRSAAMRHGVMPRS
jgi:hypothetical protein